ncbi:adenylyl-sulfate kinase [Aestuariirhabdus haliotis]|uniref:adenylyl-sulfate kinase n=1 Tax=Aestuariirhabdus haliotis TaxID=2918751 RepID=UPI0020C0E8B5|nr:adenylyl-sulfate kinase [Aestuariirhabdus haliotis]MCL6419733.1 adenylyl-sulfate kinase [Aestuariirhabdus haliotis]
MSNIVWHEQAVTKSDRASLAKQKPCLVWFTGLSGSGKSTIANALEQELHRRGFHTYLLDGDNVRHGLNKDLGFTDEDRVENIRRIGEMAHLFVDAGVIVMSAFISPFAAEREMVRGLLEPDEFIEVYMNAPLEVCEGRDPKGLYLKARQGEIQNFTGIDSAYEIPRQADVALDTGTLPVEACVEQLVNYMEANGYI